MGASLLGNGEIWYVLKKSKKTDKFLKAFGENLRRIRKEKGMSQSTLAVKTGLSENYIGNIERAEYNPTVGTIHIIADTLKIEPAELFNFKY